jgi:hypothetical protein
MMTTIKIATLSILFIYSCQSTPSQTDNFAHALDTIVKTNITHSNIESTAVADTTPDVFIAMLKPGVDKVNATSNDSAIFIPTNGQLLLYWNNAHTAIIADGRSAYIAPEKLIRVDTACFKFNFSKRKFRYADDYELFVSAHRAGVDLNTLIYRIQKREQNSMLQFFKLKDVVDGAAAGEFYHEFWALINLWTDKELSSFIKSLNKPDKKVFCEMLIETSYCDPYEYYKLYYPLTLEEINLSK